MHVVQASGGLGSWATGRRVVERYGLDNTRFLFADVLIEDDDLYRFLIETTADIAGVDAADLATAALRLPPVETHMPQRREALTELRAEANARIPGLLWVAEGRDPWQVFHDGRYLGNTRVDPCSRILKRDFLRSYLDEHFDPASTVAYIGIDWTEEHRYARAVPHWQPWTLAAPLCSPPYVNKVDLGVELAERGIRMPRLYSLGFPHNNCGGFCVKAGQAHFKMLHEQLPERFAYHAAQEQAIRGHLDKDVAILRDRRGGRVTPLPLVELRRRVDADVDETDPDDLGGCGCAL